MVRQTLHNEADADNWHVVQDRRERKRVQDRLAQRARRKRLAEIKKSESEQKPVSQGTNTDPPSECISTAVEMPIMYRSPETSMIPIGVSVQKPATNGAAPMIEMPMNVWTALYLNGSMMGLSCSTSYPAKSQPVGPGIPEPLHPTPLQLITIHPLWIDRFPFPEMRDNLINAISLVDEEDFLHDLFCMNSFEIKPGGAPWDPNSWVIQKGFHDKWGFLFTCQSP